MTVEQGLIFVNVHPDPPPFAELGPQLDPRTEMAHTRTRHPGQGESDDTSALIRTQQRAS